MDDKRRITNPAKILFDSNSNYSVHANAHTKRPDELRFRLGGPIRVQWHAPENHARKDWIGIYREQVGANHLSLITRTFSLGMWLPMHDEEWDGDLPIGTVGLDGDKNGAKEEPIPMSGEVVFSGDKLPWSIGRHEVRYYHDGKYNIISSDGPLEIYVDQPTSLDFTSVRSSLMCIVLLCLDSDPSLIPISCRPVISCTSSSFSMSSGTIMGEAGIYGSPLNENTSAHSSDADTLSQETSTTRDSSAWLWLFQHQIW